MARKMKDSGIEWIGEIPEGWEVLAHKYIMHKEKSICEHYSGEDVISLTLNGVVKRDLESPSGKMPTTFDGYQFVNPNDLLLCLFDIDVTPRCVGLVKDYGVTSPAYSRFKIHSGFCNAYYNYLLRFIDDEKVFVHLSKNLRSSLTESDFGAIKTIVPPKAEQQRIANYLDNRTFEIDTLLSKARSSIEEYKKLKQAVITQAVTKGVRGEWKMKDSGVEWIGKIPKEWVIQKIKSISSRINVGVVIRPSEYFDENGTVPFLRGINVKEYLISSDNMVYINESSNRILSKSQVHTDDILIVRDGSIGTSCVVPAEFDSANVVSMVIATPSISCDSRFICYSLNSDVGKTQFTLTKIGSALTHTSVSAVSDIIVAVPSCAEQKEIADYLDAKCAEIDGLIAKKEQLVKELESYKKSLIYEVVTGKREV